MGEVVIHGILPEDLDEYWPYVTEHLQRALDESDNCYALEDIYEECQDVDMQLWIAVHDARVIASFVTHIKNYPRKRVLEMVLGGGGSIEQWLGPMREMMIAFGQHHGCDFIDIIGRRGWGRMYPDLEPRNTMLRKVLYG